MTERGYKVFELDKLQPADWNYKKDDEHKAELLKANIARNGQIENLLVRHLPDDSVEVVNGNHRLGVFRDLGMVEVMCFDLGEISDAAARRVAVETNETKFTPNHVKLAVLLHEIEADTTLEDLAATMPFTVRDLERFAEMSETDWDAATVPDKDERATRTVHEPEIVKKTCPNCGQVFEAVKHTHE